MDEENFNEAEYALPVSAEGKILLGRVALICLYVAFATAYVLAFTVGVRLVPLISILPIFLWMLIFFTWRLVKYEISVKVAVGTLTVAKIHGKKYKTVARYTVKDLCYICAGCDALPPEAVGKTVKNYCSSKEAQSYLLAYRAGGKEEYVKIHLTNRVAKELHRYNKEIPVRNDYLSL